MLRAGCEVVRRVASRGATAARVQGSAATKSALAAPVARSGVVPRADVAIDNCCSTRGFAGASAASSGHGHGHGGSGDTTETIDVTFHEKDGSVTTVKVRYL